MMAIWLSPSSQFFCQIWIGFALASLALLPPRGLVRGLELENVTIPETAINGSMDTFRCDFHLGSDTLYSLKWYKDGNEFFRIVTKNNRLAPVDTFKLPGVNIDLKRSDLHRVTLTNLSIESSGLYKCEVSAEKSFRTIFKEGNFTVVVPPERGKPTMSNISSMYHMGDTIKGNCTALRSRPAANLTYYINGDKVDSSLLIQYPAVSESGGLATSVLGLQLILGNDQIRRGVLRLKCVARIGRMEWVEERVIGHKNFYNHHVASAGQRGLSPGSGSPPNVRPELLLITFLFLAGISHWNLYNRFALSPLLQPSPQNGHRSFHRHTFTSAIAIPSEILPFTTFTRAT